MVCIYCSGETIVKNSRYQNKLHQTWRRRKCMKCHSVTTTLETYDLSSCLSVIGRDKQIQPFDKQRLYLSIYDAVDHLGNQSETATHLTNTVLRHMLKPKPLNPAIDSANILDTASEVLKRYDAAASIKYLSYRTHMKLANEVKRSLSNN